MPPTVSKHMQGHFLTNFRVLRLLFSLCDFLLTITCCHLNLQENQRRQQIEEDRRSVRDNYDDDEEDESDDDGFIVDDDGVPITSKRKQKKHKFADA